MTVPAAVIRYIKFGRFTVDPALRVLRVDGQRIPLQDKPLQLLLLLLARPGGLVTREELRQQLWPGATFIDFEHSINTAIRKLRKALQDNVEVPACIETIPRRGYRLITAVEAEVTTKERPRLLVLPFENLGSQTDEILACGLTDRMIAQLGSVCKCIDVIAPASVTHYRDVRDTRKTCADLQADYLLAGSVMCAENHMRITAKLIRVEDQCCTWSESYTRGCHEIFLVQDDIATNIARALERVLLTSDVNAANASLTTTPSVCAKYLEARHCYNSCCVSGFYRAKQYADEVLAEDPGFAPVYGLLAMLKASFAIWGVAPIQETFTEVEALARKGLALSTKLEEAECALGWKLFNYDADFKAAEQHLCQAIRINPSFSFAYLIQGQLASVQQQHDIAVQNLERAVELDPVSPQANTTAGCVYYLAGRLDRAHAYLENAIQLHPQLAIAHVSRSWVYMAEGDLGWAYRRCRTAIDCDPQNPISRATMIQIYGLAGRTQDAFNDLQQLLAESAGTPVPPYWIAQAYLGLNDLEGAIAWMGIAFEQRCSWRLMAGVDPKLRPLAADPRFRALLLQAGLPIPTESSGSSDASRSRLTNDERRS
jgi:TolB-like protein